MREAAAPAKLPIMVVNPVCKDFIKGPAAEPLSPTEAPLGRSGKATYGAYDG